MKKLQVARNLVLIAGIIVCFSALGENPQYKNGIEIGSGLMLVGFFLEVVRAMITWP